MSADYDAPARVALGAAWLDEHEPGWLDRIVLPELDLSSGCRCVLGQVFASRADHGSNGYDCGQDALFDRSKLRPTRLGFDVRPYGGPAEYRALQAEWERVITARRGSP